MAFPAAAAAADTPPNQDVLFDMSTFAPETGYDAMRDNLPYFFANVQSHVKDRGGGGGGGGGGGKKDEKNMCGLCQMPMDFINHHYHWKDPQTDNNISYHMPCVVWAVQSSAPTRKALTGFIKKQAGKVCEICNGINPTSVCVGCCRADHERRVHIGCVLGTEWWLCWEALPSVKNPVETYAVMCPDCSEEDDRALELSTKQRKELGITRRVPKWLLYYKWWRPAPLTMTARKPVPAPPNSPEIIDLVDDDNDATKVMSKDSISPAATGAPATEMVVEEEVESKYGIPAAAAPSQPSPLTHSEPSGVDGDIDMTESKSVEPPLFIPPSPKEASEPARLDPKYNRGKRTLRELFNSQAEYEEHLNAQEAKEKKRTKGIRSATSSNSLSLRRRSP